MWEYLTEEMIKTINKSYVGVVVIVKASALKEAVDAPQSSFGGHVIYPDAEGKVYALARAIAQAHPFKDGNKRTATEASLKFLEMNNKGVNDKNTLIELVGRLADEDPIDQEEFEEELRNILI